MRKVQEVLIIVLVMAFAFSINHVYLHSIEMPLENRYQAQLSHLYPAIFWAAGHGLGTTDVDKIPGLPEFIYGEKDSFDISNIPDDIALLPVSSPVLSHIYYVYAVGWMWRLFGVSKDTLILLLVVLRVACVVLAYGIFRTGLGRAASLLLTLIAGLAPFLLYEGMLIRDFARAPFLFAFFLITLHLVTWARPARSSMAFALLMGLVLGFGVGFRSDLLICMPPAAVTLLFFQRIKGQHAFLYRFVCLALFLTAFLPLSRPVLFGEGLSSDQTPLHALLLGLSPDMESGLEFWDASYEVMPRAVIADSANLGAINVYARRSGVKESMINKNSAEYQRYTGNKDTHLLLDPYLLYNGKVYAENAENLVKDLFYIFPADFIVRAWSAVAAIPKIPKCACDQIAQSYRGLPHWLKINFEFQGIFARHLAQWGLLYIVLALCALSIFSLTTALFFAGMLAWFGGYPSIIYEYRHTFYMGILPIFALGLCINWVLHAAKAFLRREDRRVCLESIRTLRYWKLSAFVLIVTAAIVVPSAVLRIWQAKQVYLLADQVDSCNKAPIEMSGETMDNSIFLRPRSVLPGLSDPNAAAPGETGWEYLALSFDTHGHDIPVTLHYAPNRVFHDYTQTITIRGVKDGGPGKVVFYFPIYETDLTFCMDMWCDFRRAYPFLSGKPDDTRPLEEQDWWRRGKFEGISFPKEYLGLFEKAFRVSDTTGLKILPLIQIPKDRRYFRTYKTGPLERKVREWLPKYFEQPMRESPVPVNNDIWKLDETLLFHPPSPIFAFPLLEEDVLDAYKECWRERVAFLPLLSRVAALDLANKGTEWVHRERIGDAIGAYDAACEFAPNEPLYHVRIGQLLQDSGRNKESLEAYRRAILLRPDLLDTAYRSDTLSAETEDPAMLRDFWLQVLETYPDNRHAGMQAGILLDYFKDHARAAEIYNHIHKSYPDDFHVIGSLIQNLFGAGKYAEAHALVEQSVSRFPDRIEDIAHLLIALGLELSQLQKDNTEAETVYLLALKLIPDDAT